MHISYHINIISLRIVERLLWRCLLFHTPCANTIRTAQVTVLWVEPVLVRICKRWTQRLCLLFPQQLGSNGSENTSFVIICIKIKEIYTYLFCGEFNACRYLRDKLVIYLTRHTETCHNMKLLSVYRRLVYCTLQNISLSLCGKNSTFKLKPSAWNL
jgi:hypothetical protein